MSLFNSHTVAVSPPMLTLKTAIVSSGIAFRRGTCCSHTRCSINSQQIDNLLTIDRGMSHPFTGLMYSPLTTFDVVVTDDNLKLAPESVRFIVYSEPK
jgi:hypothetical protein